MANDYSLCNANDINKAEGFILQQKTQRCF